MSLRDQILQAEDLQREAIDLPEWGVKCFVRAMSGTERDAFEQSILNGEGRMENVRAKLAARTLCDADGARLFTDADAEALGRKSAKALDRVFSLAQKLCGLTKADAEELEKNS